MRFVCVHQVGEQAHQEGHPLHRAEPGLAPEQHPAGCRILRPGLQVRERETHL
jgi:hypothetical protein